MIIKENQNNSKTIMRNIFNSNNQLIDKVDQLIPNKD